MPRLLDKRVIGTDFADVDNINYASAYPGSLLAYNALVGKLQITSPNTKVDETRDSLGVQQGITIQQWLVSAWPDITPAGFSSVHGSAYGEGLFVIVGALAGAPAMATTPLMDVPGQTPVSTTWTPVGGLPFTGAINDIQFGDGIFVACGANGCIGTSSDATTWTLQFSSPNLTFFSVTFGFDKGWIAVGVNNLGSGITYKSLDGISWFQVSSALDDTRYTGVPINAVKYGEGVFVAVGGLAEIDTNHIGVSLDGETWYVRNSAQPYAAHYSVDYGNHRWIVGTNGTLVSTAYPSSGVRSLNQGLNWDSFVGTTGEVRSVCYGNGLFIAASTLIYSSADGRVFNQTYDPSWVGGTPQGLTAVYGNGMYVIANGNGVVRRSQTLQEHTLIRPNVFPVPPGTIVAIGQYFDRYDSLGNVIKVPVCVFNTPPPPPPPPPDSGDTWGEGNEGSSAGGPGSGGEGDGNP